ncbi:MAG: hypothetical protein AABW71_03630 [Nanoarchaeota archaeon]
MKQNNYQLREVAKEDCMVGACPAVYEVARVDCFAGLGCPAIYGTPERPDTYFIVGKIVDPKGTGLTAKVGKDEQVVAIPKSLLERIGIKREA